MPPRPQTDWLSEEGYRAIFDATSDAICLYDAATGDIVDTNRANCDLHGYDVDEIRALGLPGMSARRPPYTPEAAAGYVARAAAGERVRFEWATVTRSGEEIVWDAELVRATVEGRAVLISLARDIRERKRAEEALRVANEQLERRVAERTEALAEANRALQAREEHFRRITETLQDLIVMIDAEGRYTYVSPSVRALLGYEPEQLLGTRALELVHPEDRPEAQRRLAATMADPGASVTLRHRARRADGSWRWMEATGTTLAPGSGALGIIVNARDVTEGRAAEEALRESEARFRMLVEHSSDVAAILSAEGEVLYQSPAVTRMLGYDPGELVGGGALDLVHPDDVPVVVEALEGLLRDPGSVQRNRYRYRAKDGSWRVLESQARKIAPDADAPLITNSRDVTERWEAEQEFQRREAHFRRLTENSADMVQIVMPDARILYTGPSVERLLGYRPEEIEGTSAMGYLHPDDVPLTLDRFAEMMAQPGVPVHAEYRVWHRRVGEWRWFEANATTLSPVSPDEGIVINARDITRRREAEAALRASEERFRAMIENAHDSIVIVDSSGAMRYQSPSMQRLMGYRPEETAGRSALEFIHPDDAPRVAETIATIALFPGSTGAVDYRFRHRDGSWRMLEAFGRTLSPDSADDGIVANIRDVTDRAEAEEALRHAKAEAEAANHAKSEFLSRMSHELRTPLNSILGFAQILDRIDLAGRDKRAVRHILTAGEHLLNLINEVLDIARIEAGRYALSIEPVDVGPVLGEAVALVRPLAQLHGVHVLEGDAPRVSRFVRADRQRLVQVLLNLLSNAVKYNRAEGSVTLRCEAAAGEDGRERVRVWVEDTGRGVPLERSHELFTPFARLGAEGSGVEGTGLGLALSQRLAEAMGGRLWLEHSSPEGSVFCVELAAACAPELGAALAEAAAPAADPATAGRQATILYVEDNLANLNLVEQILALRPGCSLIPALQGQLGVDLAREHAPDLVLLDLHLPDLPGEEVYRQLRADPRTARVPVIIVSADATPRSVERLRAAGVDGYLTKPLRIDDFLDTVDACLEGVSRP